MANSSTGAMINLAFLGCGQATRLHSKTLSHFRREIRCFYASRERAKAEDYNRRYGGGGSFASYEAALADGRIDVAFVVTPPSSHLELTLAALRAGKHVTVEKPPFLRAADFDAVEDAMSQASRRVFVAENYFYKPLAFTLRDIIRSGSLGQIRFVHINALKYQRTGDWRDEVALAGGGALFEGGIHWINLLANLGLRVASVQGFRPDTQRGPERSMLVLLRYQEGAVGVLSFSWEIPSPLRGLRVSRIYGSEGSVAFESNGVLVAMWGRRARVLRLGARDLPGYRAMFRDFIRAWRTGEEPLFTLELARQDLVLVETIYQSLPS